MTTKLFLPVILMMALALRAGAQDTSAILAKAPVLNAAEADMAAADESTRLLIKDINNAPQLFEGMIIVGTHLWDLMKNEAPFKDLQTGNVTFKIPQFDAEGKWAGKKDVQGKLFQDIVYYLKMWTFIYSKFTIGACQPAALTNRDKFVMWEYFAKIEYPLTVISCGQGRLLLKFVKGKLFFIDYISN